MSSELAGMVLKCEKTGKLFFDTKSAELHGEETGYSDFAQVSLEEKIWVCVETGKVCFNMQQMDLHKKRVPEAQTFDEKTIADLKADQDKKAAESSGGGEPMETEEEAILRQAGKGGKGKAAAAAAKGPQMITKETVEQLVEMGFTELRAQKALVLTSNGGIEGAINWLTNHLEDADIDDPISGEFEVKSAEEIGQAAAEKLAGVGSGLSAEEKKAKLDELLAKARAKKEGTTVEEEKQKERARREGGKEMVKSRAELEEAQRKRDMEARKREKREFELERQRLRAKIEAEKEEKRANGLLVAAAPAPAKEAVEVSDENKPKGGGAGAAASSKPKSDREAAAEGAAAAAAGVKRSYDEDSLSVEEAMEKLTALREGVVKPAVEMMIKMVTNIQKGPAEEKYRKVRLSNPKIAEAIVYVPGARQFLRSIGWVIVEVEFLQLPVEGDGVSQAAAQVAAVEKLRLACEAAVQAKNRAEMEERKKEAAERAAKAKREREEMKAAMARDRAEVASRGPSEKSVAKKLPTESGGTMTSAIFQEQEEAEGRRNAQ